MNPNPLDAMMGPGYHAANQQPGGPGPVPPTATPPPVGSPGAPMPGAVPPTGAPAPQLGQQNPFSPWTPIGQPPAPGTGGVPGMPQLQGPGQLPPPALGQYGPGTQFGGVSTVNPQAQQADYGSVNQFADQAYQQSRRYLDPQQASENRRFDQELINRGIDPNSQAGQLAADQLSRQQNDQNSKAAFDAMQFGQNVQNQMFQQDLARSGLAGQMQLGSWQNNTAMNNTLANIFGTQAGMLGNMNNAMASMYGSQLGLQGNINNNRTQQYLGDLGHRLGLGNLELNRQRQDWNEYTDLEGMNQWEANFNRQGDWRNQDLALAMLGMQMPGGGTTGSPQVGGIGDPSAPWAEFIGSQWDAWNSRNGGGS
mgnify:CR=1 FL=1